VRRAFSGTKLTSTALHVNGAGVDLPAAMKEVAAAQKVQLIDLTTKSKNLVESLGPTASQKIYLTAASDGVTDNTHFSEYGATQLAGLVLQGINELKITPITNYLR
jgi:lysophospholipase L1-like esterase